MPRISLRIYSRPNLGSTAASDRGGLLVVGMAFCWSFASILPLATLIALVACREPIFRGPVFGHHSCSQQEELPMSSTSKFDQVSTSETTSSIEAGSKQQPLLITTTTTTTTRQDRRYRSRKLIENRTSSSRQKDSRLLEYRLPRRSVTVFETDRLVPTGPNPFHNSNSTEVWYP